MSQSEEKNAATPPKDGVSVVGDAAAEGVATETERAKDDQDDHDEDDSLPPRPTPPAGNKGGGPLFFLLFFLGVIVLGGMTWQQWKHLVPPSVMAYVPNMVVEMLEGKAKPQPPASVASKPGEPAKPAEAPKKGEPSAPVSGTTAAPEATPPVASPPSVPHEAAPVAAPPPSVVAQERAAVAPPPSAASDEAPPVAPSTPQPPVVAHQEAAPVAPPSAPPQATPPSPSLEELGALRAEVTALHERLARLESAPAPQITVPEQDLSGLESRLAQAEAAVTELRQRKAEPPPPAPVTAELSAGVAALTEEVALLKRTTTDANAIGQVSERMARMEANLSELQTKQTGSAHLVLAVTQLRQALNTPQSYDAALRAVVALAPQDADILASAEVLKPRAGSGIPTVSALSGRLAALAPVIVQAEVLPAAEGWWDKAQQRMGALVRVRRIDPGATEDSPAAAVTRAERALEKGNLADAVTHLERLSGPPATQAAGWLADAKARLVADKAVADMTAHVIALSGAGR